jgi:hypothetical protein
MNLKRWFGFILMTCLILALNPLNAQAGPYHPYHRPHGKAHGWHGPKRHGWHSHYKHFRRSCRGPHNHHYADQFYGPPSVVYMTPVTPVIPYAQPQPYYSQPVIPGLSGQIQYNF